MALSLSAALLLGHTAGAATDTYIGASGTDWDATADWSPAKPGAGDTALFAPSGSLTVTNKVANQSISSISFDSTATSGAIAIGTPTTFSLLLTDGGTIQALAGTTAATYSVNAPLVLSNGLSGAGSYTFANNSTNAALGFGGPISGGSTGVETLYLNSSNASNSKTNTLGGIISNGTSSSVSLVVSSDYAAVATWSLTAANTMSGGVTLNSGVMQLSGAGTLANATSINLNNSIGSTGASPNQLYLSNTSTTVGVPTQLYLNNAASTSSNARLSSTAPIAFSGGGLAISSGAATAVSQSLGAATLNAGANSITVNNGGGGATVTLASLANSNNSLLFIAGSGATTLGGSTSEQLLVTSDSNITSSLVGGGGAISTTTTSIVPWVVYHNNTLATNLGNATRNGRTDGGFVTYTSAGGFQALQNYATAIGGNTTDNVKLTATTATGTATVNSLWLSGTASGQALTINSGATLTITSGALENNNTGAANNYGFTISGGTISFGSNTGYVTGSSSIASVLTGSNGVVFGGAYNGNVTLSSAATYTGSTIVANGILTTGVANAIPAATALRLDSGGTLAVGSALTQQVASLSGSGVARLAATTSRLNIGTGTILGTAGTVTVGTNGAISPGDPSGNLKAGMLTLGTAAVAANLIYNAGSFNVDLASASKNDLINLANGAFTINGGTLNISEVGGYTPAGGETWTIIAGTGAGTGFFSSITTDLPGTFTDSVVGNNLILSYSAVPEPSAWAFMPVAFGLYGVWNLRKRKQAAV